MHEESAQMPPSLKVGAKRECLHIQMVSLSQFAASGCLSAHNSLENI